MKLNSGLICSPAKQRWNPWSGPPPVYQDLSTRHDWPVKKGIVDLPIRMKGNSKRISGNSSSPLAAQNKDLGAAALQKLLTGVKLRQRLQAVSFILPLFCLDHYSTVTMNSTTVKQRPFTNRFEGVLVIFPSFFFLGMRPRHFFALRSCSWRSLPAIS